MGSSWRKDDPLHAIRLAKTELRDAYRAGSVARVLGVYADAFTDMSVGRPSFYGAEAKWVLRHRLRELFKRNKAELKVTIITIGVEGDIAYDYGWHDLILTLRSTGKANSVRSRYFDLWKRGADRKWKLAFFIDNLDVAPQMPPPEVLRLINRAASPS